MLKLFILMTIAALALVAQSPAKKAAPPKKAATGGITGYALGPLLFKDPGCARDYEAAIAAGGIAMREQLAKLVVYECIQKTEGIYRGVSLEQRKVQGTNVTLHRVSLVCVTSHTRCAGPLVVTDQWATQFQPASEAVIEAALKGAAQPKD